MARGGVSSRRRYRVSSPCPTSGWLGLGQQEVQATAAPAAAIPARSDPLGGLNVPAGPVQRHERPVRPGHLLEGGAGSAQTPEQGKTQLCKLHLTLGTNKHSPPFCWAYQAGTRTYFLFREKINEHADPPQLRERYLLGPRGHGLEFRLKRELSVWPRPPHNRPVWHPETTLTKGIIESETTRVFAEFSSVLTGYSYKQ